LGCALDVLLLVLIAVALVVAVRALARPEAITAPVNANGYQCRWFVSAEKPCAAPNLVRVSGDLWLGIAKKGALWNCKTGAAAQSIAELEGNPSWALWRKTAGLDKSGSPTTINLPASAGHFAGNECP
jgi:hypothetical protein